MPGDKTRNTITRQWELLKLLPNRGAGKTARELADALNAAGYMVSKRQVERDLNELSEAFPIDCNDRSMPYGWRWMPGASIDIPGVTLAEALSLQLIENTIRSLLPTSILEAVEPRFLQAKAKLASLPKAQKYARWPEKVRTVPTSLSLMPPVVKAEILECIQIALLDEKQVEVEYRSMESVTSSRYTLHPLALVQYGVVTYLVAAAFDYEDPRIYAVHRMLRAEPLAKKSRRPEGFNLDEYVNRAAFQFGSGEVFKLIAKVKSELARILEETPLSEDQLMSGEEDGVYTLTATVPYSWQLRWWVLSQGAEVEILGPKWFRKEIADACATMASLYS
jgi:predicted DNA-binding transcriptional regulator YafY